jgi:hypothetical protein
VLNFHLHWTAPSHARLSAVFFELTACAIDDRQKNSNTSP